MKFNVVALLIFYYALCDLSPIYAYDWDIYVCLAIIGYTIINVLHMCNKKFIHFMVQITGLAFSCADSDYIYIQGVDYEVISFLVSEQQHYGLLQN